MKEREANLKRSYNIVEEKEGLFHNFYLSSYFVRPSMENLLITAISTRLLCKFFKRKKGKTQLLWVDVPKYNKMN